MHPFILYFYLFLHFIWKLNNCLFLCPRTHAQIRDIKHMKNHNTHHERHDNILNGSVNWIYVHFKTFVESNRNDRACRIDILKDQDLYVKFRYFNKHFECFFFFICSALKRFCCKKENRKNLCEFLDYGNVWRR